jgi:ethanolamine utilization protein EutA (predicted chaperonin)
MASHCLPVHRYVDNGTVIQTECLTVVLFLLMLRPLVAKLVAKAAETIVTKKTQFITFSKKVFMACLKAVPRHLPEVIELRPTRKEM